MQTHDYENYSKGYAKRQILGGDYVAFRDLPKLFSRLKITGKALDYGCGTGRSSRFLKDCGFQVTGVDVARTMLVYARKEDPDGEYCLVESGLPFADASFDLVFSSYVVLEIASQDALEKFMHEGSRVLKEKGYMVVITNTRAFYQGKWISCAVNFPENKGPLRSGQQVRVRLIPEGVELFDYFWSDADYQEIFANASLNLIEVHRPLGRVEDPIDWQDELSVAPYVVYVLQK